MKINLNNIRCRYIAQKDQTVDWRLKSQKPQLLLEETTPTYFFFVHFFFFLLFIFGDFCFVFVVLSTSLLLEFSCCTGIAFISQNSYPDESSKNGRALNNTRKSETFFLLASLQLLQFLLSIRKRNSGMFFSDLKLLK